MSRDAFILGGTGQIGRAVAADLLEHGWRVTIAHRGIRPPPDDLIERGAKIVILDREKPGELAQAVNPGVDALIDTIAFHPDHAPIDRRAGQRRYLRRYLIIQRLSRCSW